ncbi:MAG: hypothetical protein JST87_15045 [Bacteroidetes bacterium]|nr:hypothetical protein [Bacteroidota bacterium]
MAAKEKNKKHTNKNHQRKKKKTKSKYDEKIIVDASFEELVKELVTPSKK